jgi:hypothetical protein
MFKDLDLAELRRMPAIAFYFRYLLHHADFREVRVEGRLRGRYAAKPLYGRLTPEGAVDRSAGYNGQVAVVFLPARARSVHSARLILTRMPRTRVAVSDGRRNWPAIRVRQSGPCGGRSRAVPRDRTSALAGLLPLASRVEKHGCSARHLAM